MSGCAERPNGRIGIPMSAKGAKRPQRNPMSSTFRRPDEPHEGEEANA